MLAARLSARPPATDAKKKALHADERQVHADERQSERAWTLRTAWPEKPTRGSARDLASSMKAACNRAMARSLRSAQLGRQRQYHRRAQLGRSAGELSACQALSMANGACSARAEVLCPRLWPRAMVALDNLAPTGSKRCAPDPKRLARDLYLPTYSPDSDPIGLAWSKLKAHPRRSAARTTEALYAAIADGLQTLRASDAQGWFKPCGYQG